MTEEDKRKTFGFIYALAKGCMEALSKEVASDTDAADKFIMTNEQVKGMEINEKTRALFTLGVQCGLASLTQMILTAAAESLGIEGKASFRCVDSDGTDVMSPVGFSVGNDGILVEDGDGTAGSEVDA